MKKLAKKLQGTAANTTSWATNVDNDRGEVLVSVLAESEGSEGLVALAEGLMGRYEKAGVPPPTILHTDRECCAHGGQLSKYEVSMLLCSNT